GLSGASSLRAETGNEQDRLRQQLAYRRQLGRLSGTDDRSHIAEAVLAQVLARPRGYGFRHVQKQWPAVAHQVLQLPRTRIAGPNQDEHASTGAASACEKRLNGISAEIGIHGHRIRIPDGVQPALHGYASERGIGIGGRRRGDIVALAVEDGDEAALSRPAQY